MTDNKDPIKITEEHLVNPPMPETSASGPDNVQGPPPGGALDLNSAKIGYIVAIKEDNSVMFQPFGKDQNVIALIGINGYATAKVQAILGRTIGAGDGLTHEVGLAVNAVHQKLDGLSGFLMAQANEAKKTEEE